MSEKYNGWTNYETWNVKLWMDNEESTQAHWAERAQAVWNDARAGAGYPSQTRMQDATYTLSEALKTAWLDMNPLADQDNAYSDLLSAALSEVNWYEVAEHLLEDVEVEVEQA